MRRIAMCAFLLAAFGVSLGCHHIAAPCECTVNKDAAVIYDAANGTPYATLGQPLTGVTGIPTDDKMTAPNKAGTPDKMPKVEKMPMPEKPMVKPLEK